MKYEPKTEYKSNQLDALRFGGRVPALFLAHEMGLGKTKIAIDNAGSLFEAGLIDGVLVAAPKSVYREWIAQIEEHLPDRIQRRVVAFAEAPESKAAKDANRPILTPEPGVLHWLLLPISQLRVKGQRRGAEVKAGKLWFVARYFLRSHRSMFAIDESTEIKNGTAQQTKGVLRLGDETRPAFRRLLSGNPMPNGPEDLFSQYRFLDPRIFGENIIAFRHRYGVTVTKQQQRALVGKKSKSGRVIKPTFEVVVAWKNLDELREKIAPITHRARKQDVLDLPEKVFLRREVEMGPEQRRAYESLKHVALAMLDSGQLVTVENQITMLLRLHQIACGFVATDERDLEGEREVKLFEPNPKFEALVGWLRETQRPVIVWGHYHANLDELARRLPRELGIGPERVVLFTGRVTDAEERQRIRERFQDGEIDVLIGNRAMARGLTLTRAQDAAYYSNTYDLDTRLQSEDRTHRIGQTGTCTYTDIVVVRSVDELILKALKQKMRLVDLVMNRGLRGLLTEDL